MSDVHTRTSWSIIANTDITYNTVLSCSAYDADSNRLFASVQAVPNVASNVSTPKARGFYLRANYEGEVWHNAIASESAEIKTVVFTMGNAGQSYDLTNTRCYVRFRNNYSVNIATWALQHKSAADVLTTIASGTNIAGGSDLEIDFKNDYGAGQFLLSITYSGDPVLPDSWKSVDVYTFGGNNYSDRPAAGQGYLCHLNSGSAIWYDPTNTYSLQSHAIGWWGAGGFRTATVSGVNYRIYDCSVVRVTATPTYTPTYADYNTAMAAFINAPVGGLNTADFNSYEGSVWQCYFISDIKEVFPGSVTDSRGGEDATYDDTTDTNATPALPTIDDVETTGTGDTLRVISPYAIYKLTSARYHSLRTALFTSDFFTQIANYFAKPLDCIISVGRFPFTPVTQQADVSIYAGSVPLYFAPATQAVCKGDAINRFQEVDLGSVTINHYYDTALDYNPYTKAKIHLPFIGDRQIDIDLIMGKTISLKYHVDMITGSCIAYIEANSDLLAQYMGNCMAYAPLSGEDWSSVYGAILQATAQAAVSSLASGFPMAGAAQGAASAAIHAKIGYDGNTATGGATTLLECLQPYIELLYPEQVLPRDYPKYKGYISDVSTQLRNCTGFTQVLDIHLDDVPCTEAERQELHTLLGRGVII